ncbi:MAG: class I SAM-dependent methyltransferase [Candidatus Ranarchaeia archaeon]|jgi:ubiquinone/menaquinone biosynthesis C-methylase UbiE
MDQVIKKLGLESDSKILDVGTGFGAMSILLAMNGFSILTWQPEHDSEWNEHRESNHEHEHTNWSNMSDWKKNAKAFGVLDKITFQHLDAEHLDFSDETFDGFFMYDSLQHIKNRKAALNECLRVTKGNGVVCIIEWNKKCIEETEKKEGFTMDYVDPREISNRKDVSIDLVEGNISNIFLIKKRCKSY